MTRDQRLLFLSIWSYVDDNGVGVDRLADIVADCWAPDLERDPSGTFEWVACNLQQLAANDRIVRYTGYKLRNKVPVGDGLPLLYVSNWDRHQHIARPNLPRFSRPTSDDPEIAANDMQLAAISVSGTGEQGNRGTGEQGVRRKRPSIHLPADWTPNDTHIQKATAKGMDVNVLAEEMRNWAASKDERKSNWDAAFNNWIIRADKKPSNSLVMAGSNWEE
ncbi:hypothetical protein ACH47B_13105 [Rhodococcus sp. NPDC019627]|uniref:hypothetical protein n=1 Tax=unclassified Rhodococcus (in: high G+C Gram-positive bacteria) TaxID=192944 RepID=UPI0033C491BE